MQFCLRSAQRPDDCRKSQIVNNVYRSKNEFTKARFFLLIDLREFFFRSRVGGTKKINKKALKMTS